MAQEIKSTTAEVNVADSTLGANTNNNNNQMNAASNPLNNSN